MSVRYALLGLLAHRPRYRYELHAAFESLMGGDQNWDIKPAQVYTTLSRLEEAGLVEEQPASADSDSDRRSYRITAAGLDTLHQWLNSGVAPDHQRDEFFVKLLLSLATADANPYQVIWIQRERLYQELHEITVQRTESDPHSQLAHILLLDKATMHLEADLRWLDMIEGRLDEIKKQPLPEAQTRSRGRPRKAVQ